jgi:hypothetical protein
MRRHRAELERAGIGVVAVGFSPRDALAELATYLEWPWPFLSDTERLLYRRLHLPRVPVWQVYTPGTLLRYARALMAGRKVRRPVEDTRQLGGDAVVRGGQVVRLFRTRDPDSRAPLPEIIAAARDAVRDGG